MLPTTDPDPSAAASAAVTSDDFSDGALSPIWSLEGPDGTADVRIEGDEAFLELTLPQGNFDLFNNQYDAARLIQDAANDDLSVEAKFLTQPVNAIEVQGIIVEEDNANWIRFDVRSVGGEQRLFGAATTNGSTDVEFDFAVPDGAAQFLRVSRTGDQWLMEYSADGAVFTTAGTFTHNMVVTGVGPFIAATPSAPGRTAQIDYFFNTDSPIVPEDNLVPNDPPVAVDDTLVIDEDTSGTFSPGANDTDPDGDTVVASGIESGPENGTAMVATDGTVTYTPDADFNGSDSFTVRVIDGNGGTDISTVTVTVNPVADAPEAEDDGYTISTGATSLTIDAAAGVLVNDTDGDGDALQAIILTGPTEGTVVLNADGSFDYMPGSSFAGEDSFTYIVDDGNGGSATATVTISEADTSPQIVTGRSVFERRIITDQVPVTHVAVAADFDGDGDIDIVSTSETTDTVAWFENDGNLNFTRRVIDTDFDQAYPASVADIDDDGDIDILAGGYGEDLFAVYLNDGLGNFTRSIELVQNGAHSIFAADIDNDGDQDIVTSAQDGNRVSWYENDGNLNFTEIVIDPALRAAKTAIPFDIDGDGDFDIVGTSNFNDQVVIYLNDGTGAFSRDVIDDDADGAYFAIAADLDGDGDQDVISVSQTDDTLAWYVNDGEENFAKIVIDNTVDGGRSVTARDMDGDGDIDLFAAGRDADDVLYYENDGAGNFTRILIDENFPGIYGVDTFDVNEDGLPDLVAAARDSGEVAIYIQSKLHSADVDASGTFAIGADELRAVDGENTPEELVFTVLTPPGAGELLLDGAALVVGDTFTQADINANLLSYRHITLGVAEDGFSFSLSDGGEASRVPQEGAFAFNIIAPTPDAVADSAFVTEDQSVLIDVLSNDSDPDGTPITIVDVSAPANGTVLVDDGGTASDPSDDRILYTPDADFFGTDSFTYTLQNGPGGRSTATVTVIVAGVDDDAPVAVDDISTTRPGQPVQIAVLANDSDPDGDEITIAGIEQPANGTVTDDGTGLLTYLSDAEFEGTDSFTYTITDGALSTTATVEIVVTNTMLPDPIVEFAGETVFDGTNATVDEIAHSSLYEIAEGTVAFTFTAADLNGAQGLFSKDASGFVGGGNHLLLYLDDATLLARFQDGTNSVTLTVGEFAAGQSYDIAAVFGPNGSEVFVDGVLAVSDPLVMDWRENIEVIQWGGRGWASAAGATGFDAPFNGIIADRQIYDVALDIDQLAELYADGPVNIPPTAAGDAITVDEDGSVTFDPTLNDIDADGDTISVVAIAMEPSNGVAVIEPDGQVTYTPAANFNGDDSFEVQIGDGNGGFATSLVTVTIVAVNDDPDAADDGATTVLDTPIIIDVLANDIDADGDTLTIISAGDGANGSVSLDDGILTYTPDTGFVGSDSFTYQISDQAGGAPAAATVSVEVLAAPNTPPQAVADALVVAEDGLVTFNPTDNDIDDDGDTLVVDSIPSGPSNGVAVIEPDGRVTYTPNADFNGADAFDVMIADGNGGFDLATVSVSVTPVNDDPVARDDAASTGEAQAVVIDLLANDSDVDGDTLSIQSIGPAALGSIVDNGNGTLTYTPDAGATGEDSFTYTVTDGAATDTATVTIDIMSIPEPIYEVLGSTSFNGTRGAVLELAHDPIYEISEGTIAFSFNTDSVTRAQGLFTKDASGFVGGGNHFALYLDDDILTARFQNGTASTFVTVSGIVAGRDYDVAATFGPEGGAILLDSVEVGTTDLVMDWTQNVEVIQWGGRGWGSQSGAAGFDAPFGGTITDQRIFDASLNENQIVDLFTDGPINGAPVAADDVLVLDEDQAAILSPLLNDTDPEGDPLTIASVEAAATNGTVQIGANGEVTYTPDADFFGTDGFTLRIEDSAGGFDLSEVVVTVNGVDDNPVAVNDVAATQINAAITIDVLANDIDADGDVLSVASVADPANGSVLINADGTLTYTPDTGFEGTDSFIYTSSDGSSPDDQGLVTIDVSAAPVIPNPVFEQTGVQTYSGASADVGNFAPTADLQVAEGTIAFSFTDDNPNQRQGLVVKDASGFVGGGNHFAAYIDGGDLIFRFQYAGESRIFTFDGLEANREYEIAAVFEPGRVAAYVDGGLLGEALGFTMDWQQNSEFLQIGGLGWGSQAGAPTFSNPFSGQIADVEIFDQALDQTQIEQLADQSSFDFV
ncbi:MAG: Ig-like domain-containing protein [Pseudomonadota bacterium]